MRKVPEYRGAGCAQTGQKDQDGDVYVAPGYLVGVRDTQPVVTLDVIPGRVQLNVADARAVRDAIDESLRWLTAAPASREPDVPTGSLAPPMSAAPDWLKPKLPRSDAPKET